jgi:hypothetical protein
MKKEQQLFLENSQLLILTGVEPTGAVASYGQCLQEKVMQFLKCGAVAEAAAEYVVVNKVAALDLAGMQLNQQV